MDDQDMRVRGINIRDQQPFPVTIDPLNIVGLSICKILLHTLQGLSERSELSPSSKRLSFIANCDLFNRQGDYCHNNILLYILLC